MEIEESIPDKIETTKEKKFTTLEERWRIVGFLEGLREYTKVLSKEHFLLASSYYQKHKKTIKITWENFLENYPPYSPDFNAIEHIWKVLKD